MSARAVRTRGLTLIEVAVSSAILAMLALALMSATIPLSDASREQATSIDLDREAGRFMTALRRELRQSGFQTNGTPRVRVTNGGALTPAVTTGDTLNFYIRVGPNNTSASWRPDDGVTPNWATPISYRTAASTSVAGRLKITRTDNNLTADLIDNVQSVSYTLAANSNTVTVTLTLVRQGAKGSASGAPPANWVRVYTDQIELMNRSENAP